VKKTFLFVVLIFPGLLFAYEIMPADSVQAGMTGYGISVFEANKLDTFAVEILGVLKKAGPDRKLIIARLSGAGLEKTGIISGMSGSPVFINEKIIGAVAYAWSFSVEPLCGITPIDEMLATKADSAESVGDGSEIKIRGEGRMSPYSGITLTRIQTPLVVSGFNDWLMKDIETFFGEKGFSIVLGGGASGKGGEGDSLFLGSAVAAKLVGGDASIGAVGTVTYIDGKDVFAFGHPLFQSGAVSFPMSTAYVYAIMPSQLNSFKISSTEKNVGAIVQDRSNAIYGVIGKDAHMVPLDVTVRKGKLTKAFHFEIVDHKELTAYFTSMTFANALLANSRGYGSLSLSVELTFFLKPYGKLQLKDFFTGEQAVTHSMNSINNVIGLLVNDRFERILVESIEISVDVVEKEKSAVIETVKPSRFSVKRGEHIDITAYLRDIKGEMRKEQFTLHIPETYTDSIARITVVGADGFANLEMERVSNRFLTERPGHIIELLKRSPRNNVLYCLLLSSKPGLLVKGYELGSLPSSMLHLMEGSQNLGEGRFTKGGIIDRAEKEFDFKISGSSIIAIKIVD